MEKTTSANVYIHDSTLYRMPFYKTLSIGILALFCLVYQFSGPSATFISYRKQSAPDFSHLAAHCAHIPPIPAASYLARQQALAETLHALNVSAYIAEPGANAGFFGNVSRANWGLSERPLLVMVYPFVDEKGDVHANVSLLTPKFEVTRAKMLAIPSASEIMYSEWPEDANPYTIAIAALPESLKGGDIFVDEMMRTFVVDGLQKAAPSTKVVSAPVEVRHLRERKSDEELSIMKCANEVTLLAIRAVRENMHIGMRESEASQLIKDALSAANLLTGSAITLFGENAALPHGGGTDRILGVHDFVLFDCGGALHGYVSDVTRTFALPDSEIPPEHLKIWHIVQASQTTGIKAASNGTLTGSVDKAARSVIEHSGYGKYFTHRLGHGIGLEVHESPYLRGGTDDVILTGHTFSDEPGIYIEGKVGVRLEDSIYISADGSAQYLTEGVGGQAKTPWHF